MVVRKRTEGKENGGDKIQRRGLLWNYKLGGASASDDEGGVPNHEYERALRDLQKFVDNINDPDEADRLKQENRQTRKG